MKKVKILVTERIAEGCDKMHALVEGEVMEFSDALADRIVELELGELDNKPETKQADPVVEKKVIDPVSDNKESSESGDSNKPKADKKSAKKANK